MNREGQALGEMLRSAREARGLDRATVERDTRIRQRYLAALEDGDYAAIPGDVYGRGFVRAYASYLGLAPDTMVALYRLESRSARRTPMRTTQQRSRPLTHQPFVITRTVVAAAVLTVLVGGFAAYLGYQFVTFARTPELRVLQPPGDIASHAGRTIVLSGVTAPNATIAVSGLAENPQSVADETGAFRLRVELAPGSNLVTVTAFDPVTRRTAPPVTRRIEVAPPRDAGESGP